MNVVNVLLVGAKMPRILSALVATKPEVPQQA